ncbi:MAG: hypothetical protein AB7O62_21660 [Pirellulales bacterium]
MNTSRMGCSTSNMTECLSNPGELVKDYPASAVMIALGAGIGVGLLIGQALAAPLAQWVEPEPTTAQRLGRQVLEVVNRVVPANMPWRG